MNTITNVIILCIICYFQLDMPPLPLLSPEEASEQLMKAGFFTPERLAVLIAGKFTECQIMFVALASEMDQRGPAGII